MGILKRVVEKIDQVADEKVTTTIEQAGVEPAPTKPAPKPSGEATFVRGLGERIGFACIVAATILAAVAGLAGCNEETSRPAPATAVATCEEDQPWCWDCHRDGNRRCGADDGAVQR